MSTLPPRPLSTKKFPALKGRVRIPGDKSISHRALMLGGTALGETRIHGILTGEDVIATGRAMSAMGASIQQEGEVWIARGLGVGSLIQPSSVLDMGNSGTSTRLLMGLIASNPINAKLVGDSSLETRPMNRVTIPLRMMGADFTESAGGRLPLLVKGTSLAPIEYESPVASAQVKSCLLLAGLNAPGKTTVIEPKETRDHSERMLRAFGAEVLSEGCRATITGNAELIGQTVVVPGDPSSAAFLAVAAAITPGSDLTIENVCLNSTRTGLLLTLQDMGADIEYFDKRVSGGEDVADIRVRHSNLKGVTVPADRAASMIDEYLIMSVAAACADGETKMLGLDELRVKESDRLAGAASILKAAGVPHQTGDDWLLVEGQGGGHGTASIPGGGQVHTKLDHRMAMATLILGGVTQAGMSVDDSNCILTSFPTFEELFASLGARFF
ncbi:MAG: 3-phosphoshikimate 1-carboxyvinyltransferase [Alphaproteobacteria bacterium]